MKSHRPFIREIRQHKGFVLSVNCFWQIEGEMPKDLQGTTYRTFEALKDDMDAYLSKKTEEAHEAQRRDLARQRKKDDLRRQLQELD